MKIRGSQRAAFSLVEVALALGVASFALVAIFGLLPVGINTNQTSIQQTIATNLVTGIISDMRQVPPAAATGPGAMSPRYGINVSGIDGVSPFYVDGSGTPQTNLRLASYTVTVSLTAPATGQKTATYGSVVISWPPGAAVPSGSVTAFVALNRN